MNGPLNFRSDMAGGLGLFRKLSGFVLLLLAMLTCSPLTAADAPIADGRYTVVLSRSGVDFPIWLVDFATEKGKTSARLIATAPIMQSARLISSDVTPAKIQLTFDADGSKFDVQVKPSASPLRGDVAIDDASIMPVRLEPSKLKNMSKYTEGVPSEGQTALVEAFSAEEPVAELKKFITGHPHSPLIVDAYLEQLNRAKESKLDSAAVKKLAGEYQASAASWGPRMGLRARVNTVATLSENELAPEYLAELLESVSKELTAGTPKGWRRIINFSRARLLLSQGKTDEGLGLLIDLKKDAPFDPELLLTLGQAARKAGKVDEALSCYAELAVLPMFERSVVRMISQQSGGKIDRNQIPSAIVRKLWTEKNGKEAGLEAYLDQVYESRLLSFVKPEPKRAARTGTRVILCELFTGSECPPCVGADVAVAGLEKFFPAQEVVVLRYHQHIPGPDPLANPFTQRRFEEYGGEGTPALYVNGRDFPGAGGGLDDAVELYQRLKTVIEPMLKDKIELKIDLKATATNGKIDISAKVSGLEKFPDNVRLKLALAEDYVKFPAGNGIRAHEMVVRVMPGGVGGVAPKEGQLSYAGRMNIDKLKEEVLTYLSDTEGEFGAEFRAKPVEMKALHVVAFLQDTQTAEILQAVAVPVEGTLKTDFDPEAFLKTLSKKKPADKDDDDDDK